MLRNDRIRDRRKALGMTADDLAEAVGCNRATIYRYEAGTIRKMDIEILKKIADALGTSAAYLNGETDDPTSDVWTRPIASEHAFLLSTKEAEIISRLRDLSPEARSAVIRVIDAALDAWAIGGQ